MNDQSPPKRVTRARAAAKTTDTGIKTTKIATASSKAKVTRATSVKRKTRADDAHENDEQQEPRDIIEPEPKTTRGRAKKLVDPEPEMEEAPAPVKPTRGRPKKAVADTPALEPARSLRGRAKRADAPEESVAVVDEPTKRTTRGRAATITKPAVPKKMVKFEDPDKENIIPTAVDAKGKAKATETGTGLRAKPVRKPAATRATRGRKVVEEVQKSSPLSPKKATQVGTTKESVSEDELATNEKTPMKQLMKSPVKPPGSVFGTAKKLDFSTSVTVYNSNVTSIQNLKDSIISSPARRPPQSPFKESMTTSPQRVLLGGSMLQSPFKPSFAAPQSTVGSSNLKASLLQSPARRPQSPTKVSEAGSPTRSTAANASTFVATPKASTFKISRFTTPRTLTKSISRPGRMLPPALPETTLTDSPLVSKEDTDSTMIAGPTLTFSGRLSSIMPRDADPAFGASEPIAEEDIAQPISEPEQSSDPMSVDQLDTIVVVQDPIEARSSTPPVSPPRNSVGSFALRETNDSPFDDSDSEDELASGSSIYSPLPMNGFGINSPNFASSSDSFSSMNKTPKFSAARMARSEQRDKIGFTPLAKQLSDWMGASPSKSEGSETSLPQTSPPVNHSRQAEDVDTMATVEPCPVNSTFFDDEMTIRDELASALEQPAMKPEFLEVDFEPVELDEEDLALANEADEMSLLEPDQIGVSSPDEMFTAEEVALEDQQLATYEQPTPSEASQEYGDENAVPIDPELFSLPAPQPEAASIFSTPKRVLSERVCHTVSKIPLKPAAEDTPMRPSPIKRSASISRLPVQRPSLSRSNTVISYSQNISTPRSQRKKPAQDVEMHYSATPSEADGLWSTMGTPARTPRRDIDTVLLKGAVVFVDVHTTEGADASVLFTELLTQMGARCVKSWNWSGNGDDGSKIGITHVVYKDGGKRTLEKVKQADGVVSCVGVGWVLE